MEQEQYVIEKERKIDVFLPIAKIIVQTQFIVYIESWFQYSIEGCSTDCCYYRWGVNGNRNFNTLYGHPIQGHLYQLYIVDTIL